MTKKTAENNIYDQYIDKVVKVNDSYYGLVGYVDEHNIQLLVVNGPKLDGRGGVIIDASDPEEVVGKWDKITLVKYQKAWIKSFKEKIPVFGKYDTATGDFHFFVKKEVERKIPDYQMEEI